MKLNMKIGPFIKSKNSVSKMMMRVVIALIPIILFSVYKNGYLLYQKGYTNFYGIFYPLAFVLIGSLTSLMTEEVFLYIFKGERGKELIESVKANYGFLPGLFLSLVLPINTPILILFIGSILASLIGKMVMGGIGNNIFNPALVGVLIIMTCYGGMISLKGGYLNKYEIDTISGATPLTNAKIVENMNYDTLVKPYGNLLDFAIGFIPGSIGETSSILILIAFIYLTITKTIKWRIPVIYVLTFTALVSLSHLSLGMWYIAFQVLSGGLLFGSVFMATDPVTSPVTKEGQILYGLLLGILTYYIRFYTSYPEGVMISILLLNMFIPLIDKICVKMSFNKWYELILILVLASLPFIAKEYKEEVKDDRDFKVIEKKDDKEFTKYIVSKKGFGGDIKAEITMQDGSIISVDILESYESTDRMDLINDAKYIKQLIASQSALDDVDAISGATITSNAIKKMIKETIDDYKGTKKEEIEIVSKELKKDALVYLIKGPSFNGDLTLQLTIKNNSIRTAIPKVFNDTCISESNKSTYYECPSYLDEGYIDTLIKNQNNLDSVDTISGATISSKAIKNIFKYAKNME